MMDRNERMMIAGAVCLFASALAHLLGTVLSGFAFDGLWLLPFAGLFALVGLGLLRNWRWLAVVGLLLALASCVAAVSGILGRSAVPVPVFALILAANVAGAVALFLRLWRGSARG